MADTTLAEAIDAAAAEILEGTEPEGTEPEQEPDGEQTHEKVEETEEEKAEQAKILEKENQEAATLYAALKDPKTRLPVLYAMMAEAGIKFPGSEEKPAEPEKVERTKKATLDIMKEALGKDFAFLSERLGKALDEILEQERGEITGLKSQLDQDKLVSESTSAEAKLNAETKGDFKKYETEITRLIELYPPGPKITVEEYLRGLYTMASAGKSVVKAQTKVADKIRSNANDSSARVRSQAGGTEGPKGTIPDFKGKGALGKAVNFALESLNEKK